MIHWHSRGIRQLRLIIATLLFSLTIPALADQIIGERCYQVEPFNAPQDNATERLYIVERGNVGSGVFDSVGYHEDLAGIRTPIHATSIRIIDRVTGDVSYNRIAYGILGNVRAELEFAEAGEVFDMAQMEHDRMALFISNSVLTDKGSGRLAGSFRASVWHHDFKEVETVSLVNAGAGVIYSISCDAL